MDTEGLAEGGVMPVAPFSSSSSSPSFFGGAVCILSNRMLLTDISFSDCEGVDP